MINVSPEKLKELGNQAAKKYLDKGVNLTSAVISVLSGSDYTKEHIRRVCEFANENAFLSEFHKGGDIRNVTFNGGPADPAAVIPELMDGAGTPPLEEATMKVGQIKWRNSKADKIKTATAEQVERPDELHEKLHKAASYLQDKCNQYDLEYDVICDTLAHDVKLTRDKGVDDNSIAFAIKTASQNEYMANLALHEIKQRLVQFDPNSCEKIAARLSLNKEHSLCEHAAAFSKIAYATLTYKEALREAKGNYDYFMTNYQRSLGVN